MRIKGEDILIIILSVVIVVIIVVVVVFFIFKEGNNSDVGIDDNIMGVLDTSIKKTDEDGDTYGTIIEYNGDFSDLYDDITMRNKLGISDRIDYQYWDADNASNNNGMTIEEQTSLYQKDMVLAFDVEYNVDSDTTTVSVDMNFGADLDEEDLLPSDDAARFTNGTDVAYKSEIKGNIEIISILGEGTNHRNVIIFGEHTSSELLVGIVSNISNTYNYYDRNGKFVKYESKTMRETHNEVYEIRKSNGNTPIRSNNENDSVESVGNRESDLRIDSVGGSIFDAHVNDLVNNTSSNESVDTSVNTPNDASVDTSVNTPND